MPVPGKAAVGERLARRSPSTPQGRARHQTAVMESSTPALCAASTAGVTRKTPAVRQDGRGLVPAPAPRAYPASHPHAFGADDGQSLSSAVRKPHFPVTVHTARAPPRLSREASGPARGAHGYPRPTARPAPAPTPRAWLDGQGRRHGERAPGQDESSPAIAAHCGPARSRAVCCLWSIPGCRSARGRRARHAACKNGGR
jgi:hypothetical protein